MLPLRVALDLTSTDRSRLTGWERFALGLSRALREHVADDVIIEELRFDTTMQARWSMATRQLIWNARGLRQATGEGHVDVVHAPAFPPGSVTAPLVWTVHDDLMLGGHREHARPGAFLWRPLARRALSYVDLFVTGSHAMAEDLARRGIPSDRLRVATPGVQPLPDATAPPAVQLLEDGRRVEMPERFVLAVGTMERRKHPHIAIEAAHAVGVPLVWAGRLDPSLRVTTLPRRQGTYLTGPVSDGELAWLYGHAECLITASAYEGLDFPLLEARAVGLSVAASDIPVHREMGDTSCVLFPVGQARAAAKTLERALGLPSSRAEPPAWRRCAEQYADVYREAAGRAVTRT